MPPQTQNRKDLLQAYRLMTQRTALALIAGDPDAANQPLRRRNAATVSGILIGVIACALFGVLGLLTHSGPKIPNLAAAGTLTIDKDTQTAYVPCNGGELCPTVNHASALLALKNGTPPTNPVHQSALTGYTIGPTVGILGLPADLPTPANLIKAPWSICISGGVSTLVGGKPVGGTPLGNDSAELVKAQGQDWVLYGGARFSIAPATIAALWASGVPQNVSLAWINTLPQGAKSTNGFAAPAIPGIGQFVQGPDSRAPVGQVYSVLSPGQGTPQYFVLEQDGKLHSVSALQADLIEHQPKSPPSKQISPGQEGIPSTPVPDFGLPSSLPTLLPPTSVSCVEYGTGGRLTITSGGTLPKDALGTHNGSSTTVDRVSIPHGRGALIGMSAYPGQPLAQVTSWTLLYGTTRYNLAGAGVASYLGYNLVSDGVVLPASLVHTLPTGSAFDPTAAAQPASG
jgi:type VII secretion protein EccB